MRELMVGIETASSERLNAALENLANASRWWARLPEILNGKVAFGCIACFFNNGNCCYVVCVLCFIGIGFGGN